MEVRNSASAIDRCVRERLIDPPPYVAGSTQYETIMGSMAYGVSSDTSDMDIYGWCIPPKDVVFPHLGGEISGFGTPMPRFEQFQQHHIMDKSARKEYDFAIYNVVKYFQLCMDNNPNMIDSLFTPENCVLKATKIARHVRDNRKEFLHKGCWHKFRGYAYSQMHKMDIKKPDPDSKRYESILKYGFDVKFAYHVVRLMDEVEQILSTGDIDLMRDNERLKAIRRGDWTMQQIRDFFTEKEKSLDALYANSHLPHKPKEPFIRRLLLEVLEEYYGSLDHLVVARPNEYKDMLLEIKKIVGKL
jgi:predicted nucleotidyltransferase